MFLETYLPMLERDIEMAQRNIDQPMPEEIRNALLTELQKLTRMRDVILGTDEKKSVLHSLRANLRYARKRLEGEKDHTKRKEIEREIRRLDFEITKHVHAEEPTKA